MRISCILASLLCCALPAVASVAEKPLYGPVQYDVKERYGAENRYSGAFTAPEGLMVIRLQNGSAWSERPDFLRLSVNNAAVLKEARYEHLVVATFIRLPRENSYELVLKDARPAGMRRPRPTPKFTILSALRSPVTGIEGSFGGPTYESVIEYVKSILTITDPAARQDAASAANLQNERSVRAAAIRRLSDSKVRSGQDFLLRIMQDPSDAPEVRAEAALAVAMLGDAKNIPILLQGVLHPDEQIRTASARGLSLYPEEQTRTPLTTTVESLDPMRKRAFMRALAEGGWRPVAALMDLAASPDGYTANMAVEILGGLQDTKALEFLLRLLQDPGTAQKRTVVIALGHTKSPAAVEPLMAIAGDAEKRKGMEAELAEALADINDPRGAGAITAMRKGTEDTPTIFRLQNAYKKLTGKNLK